VSLQSSQYNFVKSLFAKEPQQEVPEKNWVVRWQGSAYPVYAINHQGGTIFADEMGLLVSFERVAGDRVLVLPTGPQKNVNN
jgi:hypothetical protein